MNVVFIIWSFLSFAFVGFFWGVKETIRYFKYASVFEKFNSPFFDPATYKNHKSKFLFGFVMWHSITVCTWLRFLFFVLAILFLSNIGLSGIGKEFLFTLVGFIESVIGASVTIHYLTKNR